MNDKLREELAEYVHDAWSGWLQHLFRRCCIHEDANHCLIPPNLTHRLRRSMETPYSELPETEKEKDRLQADEMLKIIGKHRRPPPAKEASRVKWNKVIQSLEALYEQHCDRLEEWKDIDALMQTYKDWLEIMRKHQSQ